MIFNPPFPVLKAGHSGSYSCICDVCREWANEVGFFLFFLNFPVWLVCYAHVFHVFISGVEQMGGNKGGGTYTVGSIAEDVEETEEDDGVGLNITGYSSGFLSEFVHSNMCYMTTQYHS